MLGFGVLIKSLMFKVLQLIRALDLSSLDEVLAKNEQDQESSLTKILTVSTHHTLDPVVEYSRAPYILFESHVHIHRLETSPLVLLEDQQTDPPSSVTKCSSY